MSKIKISKAPPSLSFLLLTFLFSTFSPFDQTGVNRHSYLQAVAAAALNLVPIKSYSLPKTAGLPLDQPVGVEK
jgi:hypothetical protein